MSSRFTLYASAALLPWARPELAVVGAVGAAWLAWGAIRGYGRRRVPMVYAGAVAGGLGSLMALFFVGTGRPLPSSFYAKVGTLRLDSLPAALREWASAGAWQPFVFGGVAVVGFALLVVRGPWSVVRDEVGSRQYAVGSGDGESEADRVTQHATRNTQHATRHPATLPALAACAYFAAMLVALRWFGQEDRYILPIHALLLPLAVAPVAILGGWIERKAAPISRFTFHVSRFTLRAGSVPALGTAAVLLAAHIAGLRQWAATDYALFVQNINDAHITPARWIAEHTPPGTVVAAEPIGAVRLFSGRATVDLVGLTTPAQLGHYGDWAATADLLRARQAGVLLYYPRWWPGGRPLPWARELARFPIPDNRIAGDSPIAVYAVQP